MPAERRLARLSAAVALGLAAALPAVRAHAQGGLLLVDPVPAQAGLSAGGTLFVVPRYPGSAGLEPLPIPAFEWLSSNGLFLSTDLGLGWNASRSRDFQFGARLWPNLPRGPGDGARLRGLPGIPLRIERTLFANWTPVEYAQLQSSLRTGLGQDGRGVMAEAGGSLGVPVGSRAVAGLTLGMSWANAGFRQSWFGIDPAAASAAGRAPFQAGAGWQDFQLTVGGEWRFAPHWRLDLRTDHWRLLGAAAASPLTESRWQHGVVLSVWKDFGG